MSGYKIVFLYQMLQLSTVTANISHISCVGVWLHAQALLTRKC